MQQIERDGSGWRLDGQKLWTTWAQFSDWGIVVARTDATVAKHAGLTYFYVDMKAPGIEIRPLQQMTGEAEFDEVFFTDVHLPAANLLGPLHGGWGVLKFDLLVLREGRTFRKKEHGGDS